MSDGSLDYETDILPWLYMPHVVNYFYFSVLMFFTQCFTTLLSETITYLYNPIKTKLSWSLTCNFATRDGTEIQYGGLIFFYANRKVLHTKKYLFL